MSVQNQTLRRLGLVTSTQTDADWNAVYRTELPRVYNYFRYRFGDNALAEDLTSATFEKAWRARDKYRHDVAAFSTWLFTIARNQATDHLRRRGASVSIETLHEMPAPDSLWDSYERRAEIEQLKATAEQFCGIGSVDEFAAGACAGFSTPPTIDGENLANCLEGQARCRFCEMVNETDALNIDCDAWVGTSCP